MKIREIQPQLIQEFTQVLHSNHLSHAYLFAGGFGNFELAIWLSQALFCETPNDNTPCGNCRACRLIEEGTFADLHLVEPEGQTIKTTQIRELTTVFNESGYESNRKVVIIRDAEKMHQNAANALLKSIEEPEGEIYIFLLTKNENLILPTILSRTQVVKFPKNANFFSESLEKAGVLKTQAELLARAFDSIDEALKIAQTAWFSEAFNKCDQFVKLLKTAPDDSFLYLSVLTDSFNDKEKQQLFFDLLLQLLYQERMIDKVENTFKAVKMWQSNVRFESCLNYIVLESERVL